MPGSHDQPECPPYEWELVDVETEIETVEKTRRGGTIVVVIVYLVVTLHYEDTRCGETDTTEYRTVLAVVPS